MRIESKSAKGDFQLISGRKVLATLKYENWFSSKASAEIEGSNLKIQPNNIWFSRFIIYRNEVEIGDLVFNWKGEMIVSIKDLNNKKHQYLIKAKGVWKLRFEVIDGRENQLCVLSPKGQWTKLNYDYDIESQRSLSNKDHTELLIICTYAVNLYFQIFSGG